MIPLVGNVSELRHQKARILEAIDEAARRAKRRPKGLSGRSASGWVDIPIGTMIEVPRAALVANEIATEAEFFSFGTNDLTQMTLGFSRDDYGRFIGKYLETKILREDPFQTIDQAGVGRLVSMAVELGRLARPGLKIGICGEHGGDPVSIGFFHRVNLDYVSCSPYRVPVARLAAAQAALGEREEATR